MPAMPRRLAGALVLSFASLVAEAQPPQQSGVLAVLVAVDQIRKQLAAEPSPASRLGRTTRGSATGQIRGRVFDEHGASIPDASVSFEPADPRSGLKSFEAVADSRGRFDFAGVRPGTYRVTCKALGYEATVINHEVVAGLENDMTLVVRRRPATITRPASAFEARQPDTRHARNRNATR